MSLMVFNILYFAIDKYITTFVESQKFVQVKVSCVQVWKIYLTKASLFKRCARYFIDWNRNERLANLKRNF